MDGTTDDVVAVRRFTRFYTQKFGVLGANLYDSAFSITEARVLYELGARPSTTAGELGRDLGIDAGYMSRIVRSFIASGLLARKSSPKDGRVQLLALTAKGRSAFVKIDKASARQVDSLLQPLALKDRVRLTRAMALIERSLDPAGGERVATLRPHRPGDMGWVVRAHGEIYANEFGWDITFEAMVAEITAKFLREFDAAREHCWIAELDDEPVGSCFIVNAGDNVAKLRLLILDPKARGLGLGKRFVDECVRFCRAKGYAKITLWTNDILHAARTLYERAGFTLVAVEPHRSFGKDLVGETWELEL